MTAFPADLAGTWQIDPVHSTVGFAAKHAMVATTRGNFGTYTGGATIDAETVENSTLWVDIDAASVSTGNEQRDGHLKSADFFNAEVHPHITFKSTSVKADGDEIITAGDLTIAGVTHPVEVRWEFGGVSKDPFGATRAGFEGTATLNRKDWGLVWNAAIETGGFLVSDKIKLVLEIAAVKA
ncbi:MAG TPA: YceI family protein [Kineosporiaceae bacterium]|jgi:polyisoprenoid-binding protein YceI|nr:YceI family protein [Kineosporiaceae bacterium]